MIFIEVLVSAGLATVRLQFCNIIHSLNKNKTLLVHMFMCSDTSVSNESDCRLEY
jgi:hypothetical protein